MKTIIIYNDIETALKFAIVKDDYSRFNGVIINSVDEHPYTEEACDFLFTSGDDYTPENKGLNFPFSEDISLLENKEWDKVAIITFLP